MIFLLIVVPGVEFLERTRRPLSWSGGFIAGLLLGFLVMVLFLALIGWPIQAPELIAGGMAGGVGVSLYARLTSKRVT